jgi:hypothetical protein
VAARVNAAVDTRDAAASNLATRQSLLTAHKSAVVANTAETVKDLRQAEAKAQVTAARIKLRESELDNMSKIAGRKLQAFQLSDKMFDVEADRLNTQIRIGQEMMSMEERRLVELEKTEPAQARTSEWVDRMVWAAASKLGLLV